MEIIKKYFLSEKLVDQGSKITFTSYLKAMLYNERFTNKTDEEKIYFKIIERLLETVDLFLQDDREMDEEIKKLKSENAKLQIEINKARRKYEDLKFKPFIDEFNELIRKYNYELDFDDYNITLYDLNNDNERVELIIKENKLIVDGSED